MTVVRLSDSSFSSSAPAHRTLELMLQVCMTRLKPGDDGLFNALARRVYLHQWDRLPALEQLGRLHARHPAALSDWTQIPAVPLAAFERYTLFAGEALPARQFGCDTAFGARAALYYSEEGLRLMDMAILMSARTWLVPDGFLAPMYALSPPCSGDERQGSYVQGRLLRLIGGDDSRVLGDEGGLDLKLAVQTVRRASHRSLPMTLMGRLEELELLVKALSSEGLTLGLAAGSRVVLEQEGAPPGCEERLSRLRSSLLKRLNIQPSQLLRMWVHGILPTPLFEDGLAAALQDRPPRAGFQVPPWVRVRALDPESLEPMPAGCPGLLVFMDLTNLERPALVCSEEFGYLGEDGGLVVLGSLGPPSFQSRAIDGGASPSGPDHPGRSHHERA